jgi:hypothetical protein
LEFKGKFLSNCPELIERTAEPAFIEANFIEAFPFLVTAKDGLATP